MSDVLDRINSKKRRLGIVGEIKYSTRPDKRFMFITDEGKKIHFGQPNALTFFDKKDEQKRALYQARHSKIKLKDGRLAYKIPYTASWLSWNLLW